ncbi:Hypothetical predicted protein [Paramuricea clavata]|uniref:Uncharacterized protein n=1 Tax=Paramuricea clavata TaxID=317549 RepID=A0A7D9M5Z7_PARCT|nr:Hypothetical predicted protein [Paramuricea clavata]
MTTIGKIDVFDETQESWETYVERVQHFFAANDVDDNHQVPTLLSLIGCKTYSLLKDLLLPEKPADKNFDEIVSTLQKHLNPKPLEIAERFRFYKRNQQEGESILSYIAELKKLTTHCNFGNNLEETLRDRLVCGLSNQQIQKRLLAESKLKFSKAIDIAVAMETATRDATEIHSKGREEKPPGLDKLTLNRPSNRSDSGPPSPVLCYRDWLHKLRLDWKTIKLLKSSDSSHRNPGTTTQEKLKNLLDTYAEVFEDKLGTFKSAKARITLKEGSQPQFRKARHVPYSLRPKVEEELKRLQSEGILSKVEWSDWATPIVPVPKQDGSVRICGDFKGTINPTLQAEQYSLPRIEDIFAHLAGDRPPPSLPSD